jgi:UDPglucose 6-dehydrogenase
MNIAVIGVGYVGLVTGACLSEMGLHVTCVDNQEEKIKALCEGKVPIYEPGLEEIIRRNSKAERLVFTSDIEEGVKRALVIFITVGTPADQNGGSDLTYIREVAEGVARTMDGYKLIVTKSTVPVGTGSLIREIVEKNQNNSRSFDVASNPEFLREGSAVEDFLNPNRLVIGAESEQAIAILKDLYSPLLHRNVPLIITDVKTAEMVKYASNAFLALKISYINEVANLCERVGVDVRVVAKGMGFDDRIGEKFLRPGPGFGGSCFPKDTRAFAEMARVHNYDFKILKAVIEVNERQAGLMVEKIARAVGGLEGKVIAVLGLTFKPNTDDIRESPAVAIARQLIEAGAAVRAFDPAGLPQAQQAIPDLISTSDPYEAVQGADALVLATEWPEFSNLDFERVRALLRRPVIVDLRNMYSPEKLQTFGLSYTGVGR